MIVFISGGCKNGKSIFAQKISVKLAQGQKMYYVATMIPYDDEDYARISRHLKEREGWGFETVECGKDILNVLDQVDTEATFMLDSVTALLLNEMFKGDYNGLPDKKAAEKVANELVELSKRVKNIILVSDFVYSDAMRYDSFTETYREGLSLVDRALAACADTVIEVCAANKIYHKGDVILSD